MPGLQVVHVEMVRAYGTLLRLVMHRGQLMQQLQAAIAGLQHDAMVNEEVPVKKEEACFKVRDELDVVNEQIQARQHSHACN
jgi:acyl transferase domain-containing protein